MKRLAKNMNDVLQLGLSEAIAIVFIVAVVEGLLASLDSDKLAGKIAIRLLWIVANILIAVGLYFYLQYRKKQISR